MTLLTRFLLMWLAAAGSLAGASFTDWQKRQELAVESAGLVKLSLPVDTLDAARPGLEDLRILDPAGTEVAYAIERPRAVGRAARRPASFKVSLNERSTVIVMEAGLSLPLEAVTLETPAGSFIKAVQVEGSGDKQNWRVLATGQAIFRRYGATQLQLPLSGAWAWLRLTVNDQRSEAIPFTGATLYFAESPPVRGDPVTATVSERVENPGQTRLVLNLGAANLDLASLQFDTADPLFTRRVTLALRHVSEQAIREQTIAEGLIYRVEIDGQPASAQLAVPIDKPIPSRELVAFIQNDDSPPLQLSGVSARRRPVYAVFMARQGGSFTVMTGNQRTAAPRYDLSALGSRFESVPVSPYRLPSPTLNPQFVPRETLPEIQATGAVLDVTPWRFRKSVNLARPGVHQVEFDLNVMAHAQPDFSDLRLMLDGKQLPYILEHPSISRALAPQVTLVEVSKKPSLGRWSLRLPLRGLPVDRLVCEVATPLFRRDMRVFEMTADDRGREYERDLGRASWVQTPDRKSKHFSVGLSSRPSSDTLLLETDNGDNPPLELTNLQFYYPATRLLFKSGVPSVMLYYGNPQANSPSYDLSLVAAQILAAERVTASAGQEEQLKNAAWSKGTVLASGSVLFWGVLVVVVVGLLGLISRLLPKQAP